MIRQRSWGSGEKLLSVEGLRTWGESRASVQGGSARIGADGSVVYMIIVAVNI